MLVTATKKHTYNNSKMNVGDTYDISVHHVRLYKALGWVVVANIPAMSTIENPELVLPPGRVQTPPPSPPVVEEIVPDSVIVQDTAIVEDRPAVDVTNYKNVLRETAKNLGITTFDSWSTARLQREIDEHNRRKYVMSSVET